MAGHGDELIPNLQEMIQIGGRRLDALSQGIAFRPQRFHCFEEINRGRDGVVRDCDRPPVAVSVFSHVLPPLAVRSRSSAGRSLRELRDQLHSCCLKLILTHDAESRSSESCLRWATGSESTRCIGGMGYDCAGLRLSEESNKLREKYFDLIGRMSGALKQKEP